MAEHIVARPSRLRIGPVGPRGVGWNGMIVLIAAEAALFAYLLFAYYYLGATNPPGWLLEPHPSLKLALPNTVILIASSVAAWWGDQGVKDDKQKQALIGIGVAFLLGSVFAVIQLLEWKAKSYGLGTSSYASAYFVTTGFHVAHVLVGLVILAALFGWVWRGYFTPLRDLPVSNGIVYWHFVDVVWLFVFATFYVTPYLGFGQ